MSPCSLQQVSKLQQQNAALQERALQWESEREKLHDCIGQFRCIHQMFGAARECHTTRCQHAISAGCDSGTAHMSYCLGAQASHIADITHSGSPASKCRPARHSGTAAGCNTVNGSCYPASDHHPCGHVAVHFTLSTIHVISFESDDETCMVCNRMDFVNGMDTERSIASDGCSDAGPLPQIHRLAKLRPTGVPAINLASLQQEWSRVVGSDSSGITRGSAAVLCPHWQG